MTWYYREQSTSRVDDLRLYGVGLLSSTSSTDYVFSVALISVQGLIETNCARWNFGKFPNWNRIRQVFCWISSEGFCFFLFPPTRFVACDSMLLRVMHKSRRWPPSAWSWSFLRYAVLYFCCCFSSDELLARLGQVGRITACHGEKPRCGYRKSVHSNRMWVIACLG